MSQNCPWSLYVAPPDFLERCCVEGDTDKRHLARRLTFLYSCPRCGEQTVTLDPDYPYKGPAREWTCRQCAAVMSLLDPNPMRRGRQINCQIEPPYFGHQTVLMSFRDPEWVAHQSTTRCPREDPHRMDACAEFDPPREETL